MNLATIGTSWITEDFVKSARQSGKLTLYAVYSRSANKAEQLAKKYNAPQSYTDLKQIADNEEIDVVYIASPNSLHYEQAVLMLQHKKHVICEKPIFSNTKEYEQAYQIAQENGVYLFEAIRNIHTPNFQVLQQQLSQIGQVRSTILHYIQYSSRYDLYLQGEEPNVFSSRFSAGVLVDLGVYPIYIAVALFGEPERVSYHPLMLRTGVDGSGTLVLHYADFHCTIVFSKMSQAFISCEIHGEQGTLQFNHVNPITEVSLIDSRSHERTSLTAQQDELDMVYEIDNIVNVIETKDDETYKKLKQLSYIVLSITETARKQNNIVFETET